MNTFLQVVGVFALAGILLVLLVIVFGFLFIRSKVRKFATELKDMAEKMGGDEFTSVPARIHLQAKAGGEWKEEKTQELSAAIAAAGLTPVGHFEVPEYVGLTLQGFAWPEKSIYAVLYEKAPMGAWVDAVFVGTEGTLTVTNAIQGDELDHPPGKDKLYLRGASPAELIDRCLQETAGRSGKPVSTAGFVDQFESAYAEEMDWRNSRGGVTEAEVRRNALKSGKEVDDETVQLVLDAKKAQAIGGLNVALRERYLAANNLSAAEWEAQRNRLVFVHDQLPGEYLSNALYCWRLDEEDEDDDDNGELPEVDLTSTTPRAAFASHNANLPDRHRATKVAELQEPVPADVYVLPREFYLSD